MSISIKNALNYGSIAGIVGFFLFLAIYIMGANPLAGWSWILFWIPIVFVSLAIKKERDHNLNGFISYGQGFLSGLIVSLIYASLYAILVYFFLMFVDSTLIDQVKQQAMEGFDKAAEIFGEEIYDKMVEQLEQTNAGTLAFGELFWKSVWGIIVTLVLAAILKKSPSPFDDSDDNE
jgi:hypothetical protein